MNTEQLKQVKELFLLASELPTAERAAFFDRLQDLDPMVRSWVEDQLEELDRSGDTLRAMPRPGGVITEFAKPGEVIDRYKLLEQIGEGGFGVVWMAEQLEPVQRMVALKVIKLGMDTRQVVARFEAERQALAMMDHPNIAQVLDGGATAQGRPYFVMELVKGIPITDYCDQAELSTNERLALFQQVCLAVQHAHHKGVIHRDLKPSNVLVTLLGDQPVPKVIDFGIAKATSAELTQKTLFTGFRQIVGTPEYMAPEQAALSGAQVDTRADVYSLGVLLYELLTGSKPFDSRTLLASGYDEMLRVIREVDPPKPSTRVSTEVEATQLAARRRHVTPKQLSRLIRGDLDCIAMKALEKQCERRYGAAKDLADDIARYLNNEPVHAGYPTLAYKVSRYVRRHRVVVTATTMVVLASLLAVAFSLSFAWDARAQRDSTEAARKSLSGLVQVMKGADPFLSDDSQMTPKAALDLAALQVPQAFVDDPLGEVDLRKSLGAGYWRLGELDAAIEQMDRAAELVESLGDAPAAVRRSVHFPRTLMLGHRNIGRAEVLRLSWLLSAETDLVAGADPVLQHAVRSVISWANMWRYPLDEESAFARMLEVEHALLAAHADGARYAALADVIWICGGAIGSAHGDPEASLKWLNLAERIYKQRAGLPSTHILLALLSERRLREYMRVKDYVAVQAIAASLHETFAAVLSRDHWLLSVFLGWKAVAMACDETRLAEALPELRRSFAVQERVLGNGHWLPVSILVALCKAASAVGADDVGLLRDKLATFLTAQARGLVSLDRLEVVLRGDPILGQLQELEALWLGGKWTEQYRASVRNLLAEIMASARERAPLERFVIARWLSWRSRWHITKSDTNATGRADLRDMYLFVVESFPETHPDRFDSLGDLSMVYQHVDKDLDKAMAYARAGLRREVDNRGRKYGDGYRCITLGLTLSNCGHEEEGLEYLREGYERLKACRLPINVYRDYGCRNLIRGLVAAGEARGNVAAAMREGADIALPHLAELMRGGATSDSLNQAAWAIARVPGLPADVYHQTQAAMLVASERIERWGVPFPTQRMEVANTMAMIAIRTGRWQEAALLAQRAIDLRIEHDAKESVIDFALLAMAQHRIGDATAAQRSLAHARTISDALPATAEVEAKVLLAEAVKMVGP